MSRAGVLRIASFVLLLVTSGLGIGCKNTIRPFAERGAYSVYGVLTLESQKQFIRVKPLNTPLVSDTLSSLDVTVTLENLSTGRTTTLQDSTIGFGGGVVTHNYWTELGADPRSKYRLRVEHDNGKTTEVTATTPTSMDATYIPETGHCLTSFTVIFRDATHPYEASVGFETDGRMFWIPQQRAFTLSNFSDQGLKLTPENVLADVIPYVDDPETLFSYEPRCWKLDSKNLHVAFTYLGPDWFGEIPEAENTFDPTESSRVRNGLGFFGGLRRDTVTIPVDTSGTISLR